MAKKNKKLTFLDNSKFIRITFFVAVFAVLMSVVSISLHFLDDSAIAGQAVKPVSNNGVKSWPSDIDVSGIDSSFEEAEILATFYNFNDNSDSSVYSGHNCASYCYLEGKSGCYYSIASYHPDFREYAGNYGFYGCDSSIEEALSLTSVDGLYCFCTNT